MLGVLRFDIDTCISLYLKLAPQIFPEEGFMSGSRLAKLFKGVTGRPRFDAAIFETKLKEIISISSMKTDPDAPLESPNVDESHFCRT